MSDAEGREVIERLAPLVRQFLAPQRAPRQVSAAR